MKRNPSDDAIWALLLAARDYLRELAELRKEKAVIEEKKLAITGIAACPQCGAPYQPGSAKCQYCGYVSPEREKLLNDLSIAERSRALQAQYDQQQLKKIILILGMVVIPVAFAVGVVLIIQILGLLL